MAVATSNNTDNVSAAKGVKGGYIFSAPVGTTLPANIKDDLDEAFLVLGFVSEDGYVETLDASTDDILDMNGDLMDSCATSRVESAAFTLAEIKADTLKVQYGEENVTDVGGVITVKHNGAASAVRSYVLELLLKNGRRWRKVVPKGQSTELGDLTIKAGELCAREITVKYLADESGNTCYDYYESTETQAAA